MNGLAAKVIMYNLRDAVSLFAPSPSPLYLGICVMMSELSNLQRGCRRAIGSLLGSTSQYPE
ncbi:hypothetical protein BJX62DRAFT_210510 [Aspergillus germanicus]